MASRQLYVSNVPNRTARSFAITTLRMDYSMPPRNRGLTVDGNLCLVAWDVKLGNQYVLPYSIQPFNGVATPRPVLEPSKFVVIRQQEVYSMMATMAFQVVFTFLVHGSCFFTVLFDRCPIRSEEGCIRCDRCQPHQTLSRNLDL